jgi:S1-C subfamily serine protease
LRYPQAQPTPADGAATSAEGEAAPFLTPEGNGPIAEFPYVDTGFHVGGGYVVTNRHVAVEPWVADERSMVFSSSVNGRPRLTKLVAYFPGLKQPIALKLKQSSQRDDVAICTLDVEEVPATIPALPLDAESDAAGVGKAVVLMGYPSGPDRILASLPDEDANNIKQRFGSSVDVLVGRLAELNLIKPLTTQGHITDYEAHRIIYDARTAEGGSGAPLFGQSGRVIGVNFAIFTEIQDANFAVPIRYAIAMLEHAGWKPAVPETEAAANTNTSARDTHTSAATTNQSR